MGGGFAKFASGVQTFASDAFQKGPAVFNAIKMGAESGGPEGAIAAGLGMGIPALMGTVSDTINAVKNPNGPQSIQELGSQMSGGAASLGSQLINSSFLKGQLGNAQQVLRGTMSNLAAGQSFGAAFSGAGGNKFGQNFANAAATALSNKAGGMVGTNPSTVMSLGNGLLRGGMMAGKSSLHRNGLNAQIGGYTRALAGQIIGGALKGQRAVPSPPSGSGTSPANGVGQQQQQQQKPPPTVAAPPTQQSATVGY